MTKNSLTMKSKKFFGSILIALMLLSFGATLPSLAKAQVPTSYTNITVNQAYKMVKKNPSTVILDVRNQSEYDLGHLYNAIVIPVDRLENRTMALLSPVNRTINLNGSILTINNSPQLHVKDTILVYCGSGVRSAKASRILTEHGFTNIYNMIGGIVEWMQAGYKIYTPYHYVSVGAFRGKPDIQIEPYLLHQATCPCYNQTQPSRVIPQTVTQTVLENDENHIVLALSSETNGTLLQTVDKTLLWSYNKTMDGLNRTITLVSTTITTGNKTEQLLGLYDYVYARDYNLTLGMALAPLDSETYSKSITAIKYVPAEGKEITTIEQVDFNTSVTLSQLYSSLSKVINKLGKNYAKSEAENLQVFAERYYAMSHETELLSDLVDKTLSEYDKKILNSTATIMDLDWCTVCPYVCNAVLVIGCVAAAYFSWGAAAALCYYIGDPMYLGGCDAVCIAACSVPPPPSTPPNWLASINYHGCLSGQGAVFDWNNMLGCSNNGQYGAFYGGNQGDAGYIMGTMNTWTPYYSNVYLYGFSATGYFSHVYVFVYYALLGNWYEVNDFEVDWQDGVHSMYVGTFDPGFYDIAIVGYDDTGMSCNFHLDAVSVVT